MMPARFPPFAAALLLTLASTPSIHAQTAPPATRILPSTGLWWSPGENGQFLQLAIGPGGYVLATLSESDGRGQPTYRVLQGAYEPPLDAGSIGRVASNFYQVQGSSCLECGPANGRTVDTGRIGILRFRDGTHAELLDATRVVRRYELYPLITSAQQVTAMRVAGQRYAMTANGITEVVQLTAADPVQGCSNVDGTPTRDFRLRFEQADSRLSASFGSLLLQVGTGINPLIVGKAQVPTIQRICVNFGLGGCLQFDDRVVGSQCAVVYRFNENDQGLRALAVPNADAPPPSSPPVPRSDFRGALTLQPLPAD